MTSQQPRQWSDADTDELRRRHADGQSLRTIASEMGWAKQTISKRAIEHGLSFDRSRTAAATQARVIDAKARRTELAMGFLDDAQRLREQLWTETEYVDHGGRDFVKVTWRQAQPTFADKLKIMQAATMAAEKHTRLMSYDTGNSEAVRSLLGGLAEQLGLAPTDTSSTTSTDADQS